MLNHLFRLHIINIIKKNSLETIQLKSNSYQSEIKQTNVGMPEGNSLQCQLQILEILWY